MSDRLALADGNPLDVRQPTTLGGLFGVAHIVAKLGPFSADITSYWHSKLPLSNLDKTLESLTMLPQEIILCKFRPFGGCSSSLGQEV